MSEYTYCDCGFGWDANTTSGAHLCPSARATVVSESVLRTKMRVIDKKDIAGPIHYCPNLTEELEHNQQKQEPGTKFDSGKPRMELLPQKALLEIAQVLTFGSKKYEAWNWAKGMSWTRLIGAALRHISAWSVGETKDPETGLNHLSHAACDLLFLLEYQHFRQEFDDRYKFENKVEK